MHGPSDAVTSLAPRSRMAVTAASTTPATRPLHPAWTALHTPSALARAMAAPGTALCVLTADCAAIALASAEGVCSAVHAGWRGLVAGVVEAAVTAMRDLGASDVTASLGPCIHAPCY